jgi:integrase
MGLLPRMEARPRKDGKTTYRFHPLGGKPINLGTEREAAIRKVLDLNGRTPGHGTLRWMWGKFKGTKRWADYAAGTRDDYELAWKQLDLRFGDMHMPSIKSTMVARYVWDERADTPRRANIEKALLSVLFGHGIKVGVCEVNPTIGVEGHPSSTSDVVADAAALARFLAWLEKQTPQRRLFGMAAEFASLGGSRQVEFLRLTWPHVDRVAGEVRPVRAKQRGRRKDKIIEPIAISEAMGKLLDRLEAVRRDECPYLFPTRDNNQYTARGFKTMFQRCIADAIKAKVITQAERFNFHALRHYYATVHKQKFGDLPDLHSNPATTARVYDHNLESKRRAL